MVFSKRSKPVFRDGTYYKNVWMGKRTVKDGECASIWGLDGKAREVVGPSFVWVSFSQVRFLDRFCADQHQYLRVQHRDGSIEHIRGPTWLFSNPVKHEKVEVRQAEILDTTDVLLVSVDTLLSPRADGVGRDAAKHAGGAKQKQQHQPCNLDELPGPSPESIPHPTVTRIIKGPCTFIPSSNERVLSFKWAETDPAGGGGLVRSNRCKLSIVAHNLCIAVRGVLSDKGTVSFDICIRFKPQDIAMMMEATHDPVGDMAEGVKADVSNTCKHHAYSELAEASRLLSDIATVRASPLLCTPPTKVARYSLRKTCAQNNQSNQIFT